MSHPLVTYLDAPDAAPRRDADTEWLFLGLTGATRVIVRRAADGRLVRCEPKDPGHVLIGACLDTPSNRREITDAFLVPAVVHDAEGGAS